MDSLMPRPPDLLDRAAGMLAGVALGDAWGMPAEFLTRDTIQDWYGSLDRLKAPDRRHPHHRLSPGSVTDDTDHTWLIARLLLSGGQITAKSMADALHEWGSTQRVVENHFIGPSTRRSLEALQAGTPLEDLPRKGVTVGAAMRTAPLAIVFSDREQLIKQVVESCALTHFTRSAISGAMGMAFALSEALNPHADTERVISAMQAGAVEGRKHGEWSWTPPIEKRIEFCLDWVSSHSLQASLDFLADIVGTDYYPEQMLPCAAALLALVGADPLAAIRLAAGLGGDTDTLASMVGSLCGGLSGITTIDPDPVRQVEAANNLDIHGLARELVGLRNQALPASPMEVK
jgi:ADP-ribosylglycohydrolase